MTDTTKKDSGLTRRRLMKTATAGTALAATGPFLFNIAHAQAGTIKIGFPVPLTGPFGSE
ncbi:MAG: twin-arginine translocation signal domain-containing protein, partial [Alphaproteobacteria bacterium]|nr:twin-arginine translocation signal domain-containing protein [Alphaproteobacteria bacterium]